MRRHRVLLAVGTALFFALIWQIIAAFEVTNLSYLPTPVEVIEGARQLAATAEFWHRLLHTVWVALAGWVSGSSIGLTAGVLIGLSGRAQAWLVPSLDAFRAIPVIAIIPVLVLLYGLTTRSEFLVAMYAAIWPVLLNTIGGIATVEPLLRDVAATMRLSRFATISKVIVPAAVGPISVGLSLALTISLVVVVVTEMIGIPQGIGYELIRAQSALRADRMFAAIAVTGLLGLLFNFLFQHVLNALGPRANAKGSVR